MCYRSFMKMLLFALAFMPQFSTAYGAMSVDQAKALIRSVDDVPSGFSQEEFEKAAQLLSEYDDLYMDKAGWEYLDARQTVAALALEEFEDTDLCSATVFLTDFNDGFKSEKDAFDWCFRRVGWWDLDRSSGWKNRFCRVSRYSHRSGGYDQWRWRGNFWHEYKEYRSRYPSQIFYDIDSDFNYRLFQGWSGRMQIRFGESCGGYGSVE